MSLFLSPPCLSHTHTNVRAHTLNSPVTHRPFHHFALQKQKHWLLTLKVSKSVRTLWNLFLSVCLPLSVCLCFSLSLSLSLSLSFPLCVIRSLVLPFSPLQMHHLTKPYLHLTLSSSFLAWWETAGKMEAERRREKGKKGFIPLNQSMWRAAKYLAIKAPLLKISLKYVFVRISLSAGCCKALLHSHSLCTSSNRSCSSPKHSHLTIREKHHYSSSAFTTTSLWHTHIISTGLTHKYHILTAVTLSLSRYHHSIICLNKPKHLSGLRLAIGTKAPIWFDYNSQGNDLIKSHSIQLWFDSNEIWQTI